MVTLPAVADSAQPSSAARPHRPPPEGRDLLVEFQDGAIEDAVTWWAGEVRRVDIGLA